MPIAAYLKGLLMSELVVRGGKHVFKSFMQEVDPMNLAAAVSHFLNCFLSSATNLHTNIPVDEVSPCCPLSVSLGQPAAKGALTEHFSDHHCLCLIPRMSRPPR